MQLLARHVLVAERVERKLVAEVSERDARKQHFSPIFHSYAVLLLNSRFLSVHVNQ